METMTAEQAAEAAKGLTFEIVWGALMESRRQMEESRRQMDQRLDESQKRIEKNMADMNKNLGGLGNSFGLFIETMFSTEILKKFDEFGFQFNTRANQKRFYEAGKVIAEIDSVLENGDYVMLVEAKTTLSNEYIDDHLERIALIRKYMDKTGDGRKLVGAVAGGVVPESVLNYAHKKGLYVLVQTGDAAAVADTPQGFKAREW